MTSDLWTIRTCQWFRELWQPTENKKKPESETSSWSEQVEVNQRSQEQTTRRVHGYSRTIHPSGQSLFSLPVSVRCVCVCVWETAGERGIVREEAALGQMSVGHQAAVSVSVETGNPFWETTAAFSQE